MLCTFHTSLFLRWEIKSWESCLVIRRVLSHAQQYALFPSCLCRDCASQWMGEWKIWEKGKTLALSQVDRSNDDFCQGVFLRRNWTQKNFMNAKGMLTRTSESPGFPTIEQNIFRASASEEISRILLSVDVKKHIWHLPWDPVCRLLWSQFLFEAV